jgi:peroxiredoxin
MTRIAGFITVAGILGVTVGVSILTVTRTPASGPEASRPALAATAPPAKPRAGRVLSVEAAFKELDLIRPSRQKLAEDFTLSTPKGKKIKLSDYRGKLVFMNFWATWCPPCREEMPAMQRLWEQQKDNGLVILAISLDSDPDVVPSFVKNHGFTFPVLVDPKMATANVYGVRALPSSFIIDRQGNMTALALGPRTWDNDAAQSLFEGLGR